MKLITCYLCARPQVATDACSPGELNAHPWSFRLHLKEIFLACLSSCYGNKPARSASPAEGAGGPDEPGLVASLIAPLQKCLANANTSRRANCHRGDIFWRASR